MLFAQGLFVNLTPFTSVEFLTEFIPFPWWEEGGRRIVVK